MEACYWSSTEVRGVAQPVAGRTLVPTEKTRLPKNFVTARLKTLAITPLPQIRKQTLISHTASLREVISSLSDIKRKWY
jgi:hypothetical protein